MHKEHLKHLLFNDAYMMHSNFCNHNAGDRWGTYDLFLIHLKSPIFKCHYNVAKERYERNKAAKFPEGFFDSLERMDEYADEYTGLRYEKLMKEFESQVPSP